MTLLIVYGLVALGVSFLCSLLEASLLSVPRSTVESLVEQGSAAGRRMKAFKDNIDRPLAAILTLNTIAHTVGAAGVGAQAAVTFGDAAVGLASAVMTLAILVLSEIIPKTLGAVHAVRLVGVTAYVTQALVVLCLPIVLPLEWVNRMAGQNGQRERISRFEVLATIRMGHEGGALGAREMRVLSNLMALGGVRLSEVLTPRTVLFALPAEQTIGEALHGPRPLRFSRIPIYAESPEDIVGYVTRYDLQDAAANGVTGETLASLQRPLLILPELASVADALDRLLVENAHIALVVDEHGGVAGIVTLEDVLETLLGQEIIDETDPVSDMQRLARRLAARKAVRARPTE
jgi:CBS domain containing-hemolysin-like protein